jgi:hypothetical protein
VCSRLVRLRPETTGKSFVEERQIVIVLKPFVIVIVIYLLSIYHIQVDTTDLEIVPKR